MMGGSEEMDLVQEGFVPGQRLDGERKKPGESSRCRSG